MFAARLYLDLDSERASEVLRKVVKEIDGTNDFDLRRTRITFLIKTNGLRNDLIVGNPPSLLDLFEQFSQRDYSRARDLTQSFQTRKYRLWTGIVVIGQFLNMYAEKHKHESANNVTRE
jgi:hypothetical protein